jgi:hypothetical protein
VLDRELLRPADISVGRLIKKSSRTAGLGAAIQDERCELRRMIEEELLSTECSTML